MTLSFLFLTVGGYNANAQFFKKLKKAAQKVVSQSGNRSSDSKSKDESEESTITLNEWHKQNVGKVVFYDKPIVYESSSEDDSESNVITSRTVAGDGPFSFRAYLGKSYTKFDGTDGFDIKYTMGGVSITTDQLREELPQYYARMASGYSYYDQENATVGVPLVSGSGKYYNMYTLQEDAYRILLSKIKDKLTTGASLPLKVEIIGLKDDKPNGKVLASGEITMKVTAESNNLQSLNCRCGRPGMKDANIIKEVKEAFMYQFNDVKKIYHVILLDREFTENYDNSYPVKNVTSKGMWANIVYQRTDGVYMMVKRYIFFKKIGNGFSKKATIGKQDFYLPVSPTCAK